MTDRENTERPGAGPDFERLLDWAEGRLPENEARAVAEEVAASDERGRREAEWVRAFVRTSEEVVLGEPPEGLRAALEKTFDEYAEGGAGKRKDRPGVLERFVAALSFESGLQASFGVRSAGTPVGGTPRQLVYETGVADISISVQPKPGGTHFDLIGQVLPTDDGDPEEFVVQLVGGGAEFGLVGADDLGEFVFEDVPEGSYEIVFGAAKFEILIPPFDL
ncbi:Hypothetical Protein RradSPS_0436 [Rubrobacter radiotolerans]|uniref:Uncharacterized protein n=1 Tax=Rubrobacter radiotolerans TaxID=42256 RepID=A0A023X0X6_RUBRA|nr:hypothetical protein [Rubrobacter radiotolerans]AHY45719.1 Hypothetical Protein RradSPS_0436 [Rubrobacter radiotolerans]MDX5893135.1 hypothetical protein [Rubrobacter radiotolerans]SMC03121.1 hypothetical protein SAMN00767673_0438 [Rubrobacter radiotolerans DSM 5868]